MITNICLVGMMGANKHEIGKLLAKKLNMNFVDIDELVSYDHLPIAQLFAKFGESHFHYLERQELKRVCGYENTVVSTGSGVFFKDENVKTVQKTCAIIYIYVSFAEIQNRIYNSEITRDMAKGISIHQMKEFYDLCTEKFRRYCHLEVDTSNLSAEDSADKIFEILTEED